MSQPLNCFVESAKTSDYVVLAPRATDSVAGTLRAVYAANFTISDPFSDLIGQLDIIEFPISK